ncbi:MAG TPA: hypothetical protein VN736_29090 [Candidatus Limnocylindrales bacterium]|nr:hypothetical protein [Candidatus Limnocylindrales bacterium]
MNRPLALAFAAAFAASAFAQYQIADNQQNGWIRIPGTGVITVGAGKIDGQTGPVLSRPLSADEVRTTVQTLSDGSHINKSETDHFFRDAQGRMRTETETGAVIFDPVAGVSYDVTNRNKTYAKRSITAGATVTIAAAAHYSSVDSASVTGNTTINTSGWHKVTGSDAGKGVTEEDLGTQNVNGFQAHGSRITMTIPVGAQGNDHDLKIVNERWVSDDLKLLVKSSNSDPRFGVTTYELTNIVPGPPNPSLFQPPTDYTMEVQKHQ